MYMYDKIIQLSLTLKDGGLYHFEVTA